MEEFETPGIWWPRGASPEDGTAGILRFRPGEGLRLKLFGTLRPQSLRTFGGMPSSRQEPRILGISESGKRMTLVDSFLASGGMSIPGYEHEEYHARVLYRGAHLPSADEPRFSSLEVNLAYLTEWVGESGFRGQRTFTPGGALAQYNVTYESPADILAEIAMDRVSITHTFHQAGDHHSEVRLGQRAWFRVEPTTVVTLEEALLRFVSPLEILVALGTGKPSRILEFNVYLDAPPRPEGEGPEDRPPSALEVVFEEPVPRTTERVRPHEMLFTLDALRGGFQDAIGRWLAFVEAYRLIANVFFTSFYEPNSFVDQRFLNLSRAVEAYHRQRFGRSDLPAEDHESRVRDIIAAAPEKHREWLNERLNHSDEITFRQRIKRLVREHDAVMAPLIGSRSDARERFVGRIVDARNQLTHLAEGGAMQEPPRGLFELNEALGVLLQAAFLNELGIPAELSRQLFGNYQRYIWAVRRVQAEGQQPEETG